MAKLTHEDILAYLEEATILELNDLVKAIEEKFDVTAAAPVAVAAAADAGAAAEPTEVNVTLTEVGGTKVAVIKAVREITGLGLVDAKGLVDKAPSVIKEKVSADEVDGKKKLWDFNCILDFVIHNISIGRNICNNCSDEQWQIFHLYR